MQMSPVDQLRLVIARNEERMREAVDDGRTRSAPSPIRRAVGHSIIRIGERLAAEPHLRPARTR